MDRKNDANSLAVPDNVLSQALNKIYNSWFRKWRDKIATLSDAEFDALMTEATGMIDQYQQYPLIRNLVISFVYELDARMHGGYTKASADKLLRLLGEAES